MQQDTQVLPVDSLLAANLLPLFIVKIDGS